MEQTLNRSEAMDNRENTITKTSHYKSSESQLKQRENQNEQLSEKTSHEHPSRTSSYTSIGSIEFENEDNDGDNEEMDEGDQTTFKLDEMRYADARMGICSVCNYPITGKNSDPSEFERSLLCANGHLLCYCCVKRLAAKSVGLRKYFEHTVETNCILCAAVESQQSAPHISRTSSLPNHRPRSSSCSSSNNTKSKRRSHRRAAVPAPRRCEPVELERATINYNRAVPARYNNANCAENWNDDEFLEPEQEEDDGEIFRQSGSKQQSCCSTVQKEGDVMRAQVVECSRRPIQCPRQDCAVNVAFSALTNHFIFDHPEVPIISVDPGEKSTFIVNFDGLVYESSRCLALLLVSGKLSDPASKQFNGNNVYSHYKNRLPLPILAARLHYNSSSHEETNNDVVIIWVAGLDAGNVVTGTIQCNVQTIDSNNSETFRAITYTGPINSLRTAQKPRDVFVIGDCVILHDGFINHITSGCKNLNVNVIIH